MKGFLFYALIISVTLLSANALAQTVAGTPKPARNVFVEMGGPGLALTFNYDQRFKKQQNGWGWRAGIGSTVDAVGGVLSVPAQINYLFGYDGKYFELGAGATYLGGGEKLSNTFLTKNGAPTMFWSYTLGYTSQPVDGGLNFRFSFNPTFNQNGFLPFYGIGIGYTFAHTQITKPAQKTKLNITDSVIRGKAAYFEAGGPGITVTVNYDSRFANSRHGFGYRLGIGYYAEGGDSEFCIPVQLNYLIGKKDKFLEIGAGAAYYNFSRPNAYINLFGRATSTVGGNTTIGYRYQPIGPGLNFRINANTIYDGHRVYPNLGASFGYTFKN